MASICEFICFLSIHLAVCSLQQSCWTPILKAAEKEPHTLPSPSRCPPETMHVDGPKRRSGRYLDLTHPQTEVLVHPPVGGLKSCKEQAGRSLMRVVIGLPVLMPMAASSRPSFISRTSSYMTPGSCWEIQAVGTGDCCDKEPVSDTRLPCEW